MRKDAGFEVMDRITIFVSGNDKITEIVKNNESVIAGTVLCDGFAFGEADGFVKEWNLNGEKVTLGVKKN